MMIQILVLWAAWSLLLVDVGGLVIVVHGFSLSSSSLLYSNKFTTTIRPCYSYFVSSTTTATTTSSSTLLLAKDEDDAEDDEEAWDANVDYDKEWPEQQQESNQNKGVGGLNDPTSSWDALPGISELLDSSGDGESTLRKLGIDIGSQLQPLSEKQAAELKAEATEIINDAVAAGIDDIDKLRKKMKREMDRSQKAMNFASELRAQEETAKLNSKIDQLAGTFLKDTQTIRTSTKMAAKASNAMSKSGKGLDIGTWGTLRDGTTVIADDSIVTSPETNSLLGSVESNTVKKTKETAKKEAATETENRILIIADIKQDIMAKSIIDGFIQKLKNDETLIKDIPNIDVDVLSPTSTIPLGGNNAACVIIFCTSITQDSTLKVMMERLLRKTMLPGGKIGIPPTQFIGISSVGTQRTDKFPYSMQNLMGGKLDKRRQIEELIINTVIKRSPDENSALDYTIIKFGEISKNNGDVESSGDEDSLSIQPGDVIDDPITSDAAIDVLLQAVAFQPFARNATLCASGSSSATSSSGSAEYWTDKFLCLDGPELWRYDIDSSVASVDRYDELVEYVQGWAEILADTGKGLTTPVLAEPYVNGISRNCVKKQDGTSLLFKPTKTGKKYMSSKEERQREQETTSGGRGSGGTAAATQEASTSSFRRTVREGGVDVVVELVERDDDQKPKLRVRARRCNYANDAVIKELSEQTIVKRLNEAIDVWMNNDHK